MRKQHVSLHGIARQLHRHEHRPARPVITNRPIGQTTPPPCVLFPSTPRVRNPAPPAPVATAKPSPPPLIQSRRLGRPPDRMPCAPGATPPCGPPAKPPRHCHVFL